MKSVKSRLCLLCLSVGALLVACGDEPDSVPLPSVGSAAGTEAQRDTIAPAVVCGGETCTVNSVLMAIVPNTKACCTNNKCGQRDKIGRCLEKNAPGTPDAHCPDVISTLNGSSYPQAGCCTPQGTCGGNFTAAEIGCLAREQVDSGGMGGPLEAIACGQ